MDATDPPCPPIDELFDDLDMQISHLGGYIAALDLLADEFGLTTDSPQSAAFWAVLAGAEKAQIAALTLASRIRRAVA